MRQKQSAKELERSKSKKEQESCTVQKEEQC
jgi:hypothetical protein